MLGVRTNPTVTPADVHLRHAAEAMGVGSTFHLAPVGVFFGDGKDGAATQPVSPGEACRDPYFGGAGPTRRACLECGECMTGCRHGAKNMLTENYLYFAERHGAVIHPMTTVVAIRERPATRRAYALSKQVNPNAGKALSDEERKILFGQAAR